MLFDLSNQKDCKSIKKFCLSDGKIINQILLARKGLSIPPSIVLLNHNEDDKNLLNEFCSEINREYQVRSENIGSTKRYSESSTGLSPDTVINEFERIVKKDCLVLVQKLPKNALYRDSHSAQYCIQNEKLIIEVRAGIATHLARFGWPPSEVYEIPVDQLNQLIQLDPVVGINIQKDLIDQNDLFNFRIVTTNEILKQNLFLDCVDFGLRYLKQNEQNYIKLPYNNEQKRIKKLYEISEKKLSVPVSKLIVKKELFEQNFLDFLKGISKKDLNKWLREFSTKLNTLTLKEYLSLIGFLNHYSSNDKYDSLKIRIHDFINQDLLYTELKHSIVKKLVKDTIAIKNEIKHSIAKLSIIANQEGYHIIYWDLIS